VKNFLRPDGSKRPEVERLPLSGHQTSAIRLQPSAIVKPALDFGFLFTDIQDVTQNEIMS
jgi:hypothetical protein